MDPIGGEKMICFKDQTFCLNQDCEHVECFRYISDKIIDDAIAWWGSDSFPMSLGEFKDCEWWEGTAEDHMEKLSERASNGKKKK